RKGYQNQYDPHRNPRHRRQGGGAGRSGGAGPSLREERSQPDEGSAAAPENGRGRQNPGGAEKEVESPEGRPSGARQAGGRTARGEQGRPDPGVDRALPGSQPGRDPEDDRLAGA